MASAADSRNPSDSSCGVVAALPTVKSPFSSTTNVSVIVPPASIPSTRGFRATALPPLRVGAAAAITASHPLPLGPRRQLPRHRKKCQGEIEKPVPTRQPPLLADDEPRQLVESASRNPALLLDASQPG